MIEKSGWQGIWKIRIYDKAKNQITKEIEIKNRIMNTALDELLKVLQGDSTNLEIKYMALGTGSTALTNTDTVLDTEIFRTPISTQSKTGTGELTTSFIVLDSEAVGAIEEIGIFGGTTATASVDTGTLISRILWTHNKTSLEEIQFTRVDKIGRV